MYELLLLLLYLEHNVFCHCLGSNPGRMSESPSHYTTKAHVYNILFKNILLERQKIIREIKTLETFFLTKCPVFKINSF